MNNSIEHFDAPSNSKNKPAVMNCHACGKFVSQHTAGKVETEVSDLDGMVCIVDMWCKQCSAKNR